jgi:phosphohistidine phosphatase
MRLLVMRHGIAADRATWLDADAKRPLTAKGIAKTRSAAQGLSQIETQAPLIATSPLLRARQTADLVREAFATSQEIAVWPELEYAEYQLLLGRLRKSDNQSTLIVGHEPGLSRFVVQLLTGRADGFEIEFKKSAVCCLEIEWQHSRPQATLLWFFRAGQLQALKAR